MKWISIIAILCLAVWACGNNTDEKSTTNDSLSNKLGSDSANPSVNTRNGTTDTGSYDRMSQRITDSVPQ
jgi:hypothetical protein